MLKNYVFAFLVLALPALTATAAPQVFVSAGGNDMNACDRFAPCATFAAAQTLVDAGGDIIVLDSGNYGVVTITKSLQILAPPGITASVTPSGTTTAITVAAGTSDKVLLRGLTLNGKNTAVGGVFFSSGSALTVENCTINGFNDGIAGLTAGKLFIRNTIVENNHLGIYLYTTSGTERVSIEDTRIENNTGYGVSIGNGANVSVNRSIATGNDSDGFAVSANGILTVTDTTASYNGRHGFTAQGGVSAVMTLDDCKAIGNTSAGVYRGSGGSPNVITVRVSNTTATGNGVGFQSLSSGGTFESYANNRVRGNTTNISGTITTVGQN